MGAIGRAGPVLSARLCASLQANGDRNFFLLGIPAGHLKGKRAFGMGLRARKAGPATGRADLSKTAGAVAKAKA
jgi:hypothetical protein